METGKENAESIISLFVLKEDTSVHKSGTVEIAIINTKNTILPNFPMICPAFIATP